MGPTASLDTVMNRRNLPVLGTELLSSNLLPVALLTELPQLTAVWNMHNEVCSYKQINQTRQVGFKVGIP
jgi:hypothetical protein